MKIIYITFGLIILFMLFDINDKLKILLNKDNKSKLDISNYLNKDVYIVLNNDNITNSYLFSSVIKTVGKLLDYDDNWFIFEYYDKNSRKNIEQYFKISDLESINEIII